MNKRKLKIGQIIIAALGGLTLIAAWASNDSSARQSQEVAKLDAKLRATPNVHFQHAYIRGVFQAGEFYIHETEEGFRELQHLFLGALSRAESIGPCCADKAPQRVRLSVRAPYYVNIGEKSILIETVDLMWPKEKGSVYLVLNDRFTIQPQPNNRSLDLLSEWAYGRGFR